MKKKKDYWKKILSSRVLITVIALALQFLALISVILKFNDYFAFFYGGSIVVSLLVVLYILYTRSNPVYKIAWIIPILIFPIFGGFFYIFFGVNKLSNRRKRSMQTIFDKTKEILGPQEEIIAALEKQNKSAGNQARYIQNYSYYPPYRGTCCEYLPTGEHKFARLLAELEKAKRYIFLEYFIIEEGLMWNRILEILAAKVQEGLDVRVIYDDFGCLLTLPYKYNRKLEELGIQCAVFNPVIPILSPRHNNRDHRKIAVIDGKIAFTGGINLADEYINAREKYGHWKDSAIMLCGEAAWSLTVMFLTMWEYLKGIKEDYGKYYEKFDGIYDGMGVGNHPLPAGSFDGNGQGDGQEDGGLNSLSAGIVQPFADSPLDNESVSETVYFNLISKAQKYLYITTPYLIINNEILTALANAAKGGVDVRIVTPHIPDKWYVHAVTRSYYRLLIEAGVKIFEYTPGFIHSKTLVADDEYGIVGTINLDYRSLFLHFECGVWLYGCSVIQDMYQDMQNTFAACQEITLQDLEKVPWHKTLLGFILRVFAPLM